MALPSYIIQRNNKNRKIELTEFKNITNLNNIFNSIDFTVYLISRKYENPRKASEMGIYFYEENIPVLYKNSPSNKQYDETDGNNTLR